MTTAGVPGLVSVVVASYNHARFLDRRMESLLAQTYQHIEIVVIDDRSHDDSVAVLGNYASLPNVQLVVRERNGGWVAVSNQGIARSTGQYVLFANCDDSCESTMIARLVESLSAAPSAGVSFCRSLLIDENGRVIGDDFAAREPAFQRRCRSDTVLSAGEMYRFLFDSCVIPNLSAALIRRECFESVGVLSDSYKVCCDWDLFFRIFAKYDATYVAAPLNHFRQHATTIRSSTKERVIYSEYLTLLLPKVHAASLSLSDRTRARWNVMSIWALHLIAPSWSGLRDFGHHLALVRQHDPVALLWLPAALLRRVISVLGKAVTGRHVSPAT